MGLFDTIGGLQQVIEQQNRVRDAALLGLPEKIHGFDVRMMTLSDYIALRLIRNPFVSGGEPSATAVFEFMKRVHLPAGWLDRRRLIGRCRRCRFPSAPMIATQRSMSRWAGKINIALESLMEISRDIQAYVDESIQDWPMGKLADGETESVCGLGVTFCAMLWREYQWPFEKTLNSPVKLVMQCVREIQMKHGKKTFPSKAKEHINGWLLKRN